LRSLDSAPSSLCDFLSSLRYLRYFVAYNSSPGSLTGREMSGTLAALVPLLLPRVQTNSTNTLLPTSCWRQGHDSEAGRPRWGYVRRQGRGWAGPQVPCSRKIVGEGGRGSACQSDVILTPISLLSWQSRPVEELMRYRSWRPQ
jgi:hypothetical protein